MHTLPGSNQEEITHKSDCIIRKATTSRTGACGESHLVRWCDGPKFWQVTLKFSGAASYIIYIIFSIGRTIQPRFVLIVQWLRDSLATFKIVMST